MKQIFHRKKSLPSWKHGEVSGDAQNKETIFHTNKN